MLAKIKRLKSFKKVISKLDTETKNWRVIGGGSYGRAYDMGDGRVCKITTSKHETKVASKLRATNKNFSYLYKVHSTHNIVGRNKKFRYGLVITPRYKQLTENQHIELFELFNLLDIEPSFRFVSMRQIEKRLRVEAYDRYNGLIADRYIPGIVKKHLKVFKKYHINYMLRNLRAAKLRPEDIHYENILKHKNKYVLIDIAC